MPAANYAAVSDVADKSAPGGFSVVGSKSWTLLDVDVEAEGLKLVVKSNACCMKGGDCPKILVLANGTAEAAWFRAADSRLSIGRESLAADKTWKPTEYRLLSDCLHSYHKVALNPGRAWTWDVPSASGAMKTKSRYVLYGLEKPLVSNEFDSALDPAAFLVPESVSKFAVAGR